MIPSDPGRPAHRRAFPALVFASILAVASPIGADEPPSVQPAPDAVAPQQGDEPFNGAFTEWSVRGGAVVPTDGSRGWIGDVGFRHAFPMYVGDTRLAYQHARWDHADETVGLHDLSVTFGLHPFFLALLSEGTVSHVLASLHLELGLGAQLARHSRDDVEGGPGLAGSVGTGFDIPLTRPNRGDSLWINAVYRYKWSTIDLEVDEGADLHGHQIFIGLAWRNNGILW